MAIFKVNPQLRWVIVLCAVVGVAVGQLSAPFQAIAESGGQEECDFNECDFDDPPGTCVTSPEWNFCEDGGGGAFCDEFPCT